MTGVCCWGASSCDPPSNVCKNRDFVEQCLGSLWTYLCQNLKNPWKDLFSVLYARHSDVTFHFLIQGVQYAHWAPGLRRFWKKGLNRVYAFWFVFVTMTIVVSTAVSTDYLNWDRLNRDFVATNELSRAFLASFILVMDLLIVMQVRLR